MFDSSGLFDFFTGAWETALWTAPAILGWWAMFRMPLGWRRYAYRRHIAAPVEKVWRTYVDAPPPEGGWGGGVEISDRVAIGDPPTHVRFKVRRAGAVMDYLVRVLSYERYSLYSSEVETIDGKPPEKQFYGRETWRFTPDAAGVSVDMASRSEFLAFTTCSPSAGFSAIRCADSPLFAKARSSKSMQRAWAAAPTFSLR